VLRGHRVDAEAAPGQRAERGAADVDLPAARRDDQDRATQHRAGRARRPAPRQAGAERNPLREPGRDRGDPERHGGGDGGAGGRHGHQEGGLEGRGGRGRREERGPAARRERPHRRRVGGEDDGGEHQPTDEDPGAAQGRRVDDGTRHDLGGPDGRPEDARRQDEQDAGSLVSLLHPVEGSRIDGWITGKPNIVRSGRARWPAARFGAVPGRIGRTTFGDHPTRQPSRRGACRTPRK
jgi:hypothetical protein